MSFAHAIKINPQDNDQSTITNNQQTNNFNKLEEMFSMKHTVINKLA